jgi:integrase
MAKLNLTQKSVASLRSDGTDQQFYDEGQTGLVLRVSPNGDKLSWSVLYRDISGKRQRVTLRGADAATLKAARDAAKRIVGAVVDNKDVAAERRQAKAAISLSDLLDAYLERRASELRSSAEIKRRLDSFVRPALGDLKAREVTREQIADLMDKIKLGQPITKDAAVRKASPATANRTFDDLKAVFSWGLDKGLVEKSPMIRQKRPAESAPRERVLSMAECRTILERLPSAPLSTSLHRIIALLIYTGARASEVAELRKSEIDLDAGAVRLPASRTKNARAFVIPLTPPALAIVKAALADAEQTDFLFPSPRSFEQAIDGHAVSTAARRAQNHFGLPHWTAHDFRRAISTGLGDAGTAPHVVDRILNHVDSGVTARHYNFSGYLTEHRAALELWAEKLIKGKLDSA